MVNIFRLALYIGAICVASYSYAENLPERFFYKDNSNTPISFNEGSTGCTMSGILVHPIEDPKLKVIWFNTRTCKSSILAVSFISRNLFTKDGTIHKGEQITVSPAKVTILYPSSI